jgi:hypothetical protein
MTKENGKVKNVMWIDPDGIEVPVKYIAKEEQERNLAVTTAFDVIAKLEKELEVARDKVFGLINGYLDSIAASYGEKWQGNAMLLDFGHNLKIEIQNSKRISFDEKLQIAKTKIDECVKKWSEKTDGKIKLIIDKAFSVDKQGMIDTKLVLGLRNIKIDDELWMEAMQLIADSVTVTGTKQYMRFYRKNAEGVFEAVKLDFC